MLKKDKESIKEHYLEDGFDDYIRKECLEEDFDKMFTFVKETSNGVENKEEWKKKVF